jgi:hypothetical protein
VRGHAINLDLIFDEADAKAPPCPLSYLVDETLEVKIVLLAKSSYNKDIVC